MKIVRPILRYAYAPLFFFGFIGAAIALVEVGMPGWVLPILLLPATALSFAAERLLPYELEWNRDQGDSVTNVLHAVVNEISIFLSVASPQGLFARQRFLGHKRNMGYATRFNRAIGSLSGWNSPAGSRLACSQR